MSIAKFKALMWKSYRLRRFRWIHTLVEFSLPFLIAFLIPSPLFQKATDKIEKTIYPSISRHDFISDTKKIKLYYAPSNFAIKNFMDQIQNNFASVQNLPNETELELALKNDSKRFGIFFENITSNESLPNKLRYKLKNSGFGRTRILYRREDAYSSLVLDTPVTPIAPIQLLVNENFIKNKTNINISTEFEFEWFPFPSRNASSFILPKIPMLVKLTMIFISYHLINDIIEEKNSGMKELIKLTGLNEWTIWFGWFAHAFVISFISFSVVSFIAASSLKEVGLKVILTTRFPIFWVFLILCCTANISVSFIFSSIFHRAEIAKNLFICFSVVQYYGMIWLLKNDAHDSLLTWFAIIPNGALDLGFQEIYLHETQGKGLTWSSVMTSRHSENSLSLLFYLSMLLFDTFLYLFLAYYITSINPGKFGTPKSPIFIFENLLSSFFKKRTQPFGDELEEVKDDYNEVESEYFEPPPPDVEAILRIINVHKKFGSVHAVRGVNLNVYPNELTVLLGHNGAGKTATISILTGQTSPNTGSIYYKNRNIFEDMASFRNNVGVCPQENRTLSYLTVMEHLIFFGKLRESSFEAAVAEANGYLTMMKMQAKKDVLVAELSGGMTRKLSISIALMGKAEILILDEPTSGLDVQSRRKFWDLLMYLREERTIIFTTHYMKEADVLGDRIAIMSHGLIVCHGTPMFLKKVYGTGYELTIIKSSTKSNGVDEVIKRVLPSASREHETSKKVVYKLPLTETEMFPILFKNLESKMKQLGIESFGVSASTVEHIFLKANDKFVESQNATRNTTDTISVSRSDHVKGLPLYIRQITVLFKKRYLYTSRNLSPLLYNLIAPMVVGFSMRFMIDTSFLSLFSMEPPLNLSMTTYPGSTVLLRNHIADLNFGKHLSEYVAEQGGSLINVENTSIETELLKLAEDNLKYHKKYITAFELNSKSTKILSNPALIHSLPITITTYSNVVLRKLTNSKLYEIVTIQHPVREKNKKNDDACGSFAVSLNFYILWLFCLLLNTTGFPWFTADFVHMERIDGFQHIQFMSNVSPLIYWLGTFLFDVTFFLCVTLIRVGLCKIVDRTNFLGFDTTLGVFMLFAIAYGMCGTLFFYTIDYLRNSKEVPIYFSILSMLGVLGTFFIYSLEAANDVRELRGISRFLLIFGQYVIFLVPPLNFSLLFIKFMDIFNSNTRCSYCSEIVRPICEETFKKKSYYGLLFGMIFLIIDIALYSIILYCINNWNFRKRLSWLENSSHGKDTTNQDGGDDDVQEEYEKVQQYKNDESKMNEIVLLVDGLHKKYINRFKPLTAVFSMNFIVEPGECFGLLGTNGAGKTTTFKMLVAEINPTSGDASIRNVKLSTDKWQYISMAGYCPQTNSLIEELTGKEMLTMIATFRGVPRNETEAVVHEWINILGLNEYQNRRCGTYSGGNKRKLCALISLVGDPAVVFLDEPTSGVDPISRHNIYNILIQSKGIGQSVVFASHSVDECENICDRLTIMDSGLMKCIGTPQHLKKLYAQGFSILIKMNNIPNFNKEVVELKKNMLQEFTEEHCILKDEHMGILDYHITDTSLAWSTLFEIMGALKSLHQELIADYLLAETTLEEVFSSFAKNLSNSNQG